MKQLRFITLGFASTLLGTSLLLSTNLNAQSEEDAGISRLSALAKYTKILATVEKYYVDDIKFNEIIEKSIDGLLSNLDAHSSFLDTKKFKDMKVQTEGEFGGLGITVGIRDGALTVIAPIEGTPADKAGLEASDIILRIDGQSTLNMTIDEAVNVMRGKPKTDIILTIVRKGKNEPFDVTITRDIIKVDSVYTKLIENEDILYLRITSFDKNVVSDTKDALAKHRNVKGIIMDLRNNPGGLLTQAIGLSDLFIDEGIIVSQKGRIEGEDTEHKASKSTTITDIPMAILINGGSASASEIVSGALQDHKRAVLVGEKTFGKGSVQVILPINDSEALRLTIARYYLPSGRTIQAVGVTPDITVYPGSVPQEKSKFSIKENDLKKHLTNELHKINGEKIEDDNKTKKDLITKDILYKDMQLKSAVDIVKVLNITK